MSSQSDCTILPTSPGPLSDDDAFNTTGARLHFGPLRSPEKMFASIVARSPTCTTDLAPQPPTSSTTLNHPVFTKPTTSIDMQDVQKSQTTTGESPQKEEVQKTDTRGAVTSQEQPLDMAEDKGGSEKVPETTVLLLQAGANDEPSSISREQSLPISESSVTDTINVANALVPDSPTTPRASTMPKSLPTDTQPSSSTPTHLPNVGASSSEEAKTPQPADNTPTIPQQDNKSNAEADSTTPRAAIATPTRLRPNVTAPTTIDRELGSLSPTSNNLLGQLLATPGKSPQRFLRFSVPENKQAGASTSSQSTIAPFPRSTLTLETPQRTPRPFPSPLRAVKTASPARRAPTDGGPESKPFSLPESSSSKSIFARTAGFDSLPPGSPAKSPVRRLPMLVPPSTLASPNKAGSSRVPATPARSGLVASKGADKSSPVKGADAPKIRTYMSKSALAASSSAPTTSTTMSTLSKPLPYPIGPVRTIFRKEPAPSTESSSDTEPPSSQPDKPEATKSLLKQSTSSRIPRPKPYARPATAARRTLANRRTKEQAQPSNEEAPQEPPQAPPNKPQEPLVPPPAPASAVSPPPELKPASAPIPALNIGPVSPLKRKRLSDEASDGETQPTARTESRRQVKIPRTVEEAPAIVAPQPHPARLVSRRLPTPHPARTLDEELAAAVASSDPSEPDAPSSDVDGLPSSSPPSSSAELPGQGSRSDNIPLKPATSSPEVPPIAAYPEVPRRTRTRRTLDLSGDNTGPSTLGARTIRRRTIGQHLVPPSDNFCGLSAIALKALTSQNTARNEKYLMTKLMREEVRKDGIRPESPGVKAKTTSQRQQEEIQKQRQERAERRARRGGRGSDSSNAREELMDEVDEGDAISDEDGDGDSEVLDSSPPRPRHRRGPGDEDDYETPIRPRTKDLAESEETAADRRVRWDRGLFTEVYLDEVKFGTRKRGGSAAKGCLAPSAKALPLDNLGNLPDATSPFTDIEQHQVVIKKFIYDNDLEPVPEPVVVKPVTRQRSKKAKS